MKGAAFVGDTDAEVLMTHVMSRYKSEFMRISYCDCRQRFYSEYIYINALTGELISSD